MDMHKFICYYSCCCKRCVQMQMCVKVFLFYFFSYIFHLLLLPLLLLPALNALLLAQQSRKCQQALTVICDRTPAAGQRQIKTHMLIISLVNMEKAYNNMITTTITTKTKPRQ